MRLSSHPIAPDPMHLLTDRQAESVSGGLLGSRLLPSSNTKIINSISVQPRIAVLPQLNVGVNAALFGGLINQDQVNLGSLKL